MAAKKVNTMDFRINFDIVNEAKGELNQYAKQLKEIQSLSSGRLGSKVAGGLLGDIDKQLKQLDQLTKSLTSPKLTKGEKLKLIDITAKDLTNMKTMLKDASTFWNTEIKKSVEAQKKLDTLLAKRKDLTTLKGRITKNSNKLSSAEQALKDLGYEDGTTTKDKAAIESKVRNLKKDLKNTDDSDRKKELEEEIKLLEKVAAEIQKVIDARKKAADLNKEMKALTALDGVAGTTDPTAGTKRIDKAIAQEMLKTEGADVLNKISAGFDEVSDKARNSSSAFDDFGTTVRENLNTSYDEMQRFQETTANLKQILASFGIGFSAYQIANYFKQLALEALNFYRSLDAALIEIRVVSNLTAETVANLKEEFITMSKESGMAIDDITKAAVLFFQQGLNTEEVLEMTEVTAQFAKVAGVDATKAADQLTAAVNGYCLAAEDASLVADKFNKVAAASAADINELSTAFSKAAAQANQAGVSMDNYLAYIATMEEATREAPENIGTSLKTIFSRMQQVKKSGSTEDGDTDVNQVETALKSVGVQLRDTQNELRDLEDVLDELGAKWHTLDINTQAYLGTIIAGTRQQSRFITLMQNWDRVIQLSEESQNSAGQQALMHQKSMESLNTAIQQLSNAWETFISNLTESDAIKNIVKFLTQLINLINKGNAPIVTLAVVVALLSKRLSGLGSALLIGWNNLKKFGGSLKDLGKLKQIAGNFELMGISAKTAAASQEKLANDLQASQDAIDANAQKIAELTLEEGDHADEIEQLLIKQQLLEDEHARLEESFKATGIAAQNSAMQYQKLASIIQTTQQVAMILIGTMSAIVTAFGMADDTSGQLIIGITSIMAALGILLVVWTVFKVAVKKGLKEIQKALVETGVGAIVVAIGMAISGLITIISSLVTASETAAKKMNEAIQGIGDKLDKVASAATAIGQVEKLISKYEELSKKVYRTAAEQKELNDTIQALGDTYDIEVLTDKYGNLSISIAEVNERLAEEREELAELNEELDKAEKDGYKDNKHQSLKFYDKLFAKNRSDYKKLLTGIEDVDIDTSRLKASAQEIEDIEINLKNAIMDSAEDQAYYLGKQEETISDYIVGLNDDLNEAMDDDAWEEYYTMLGEFGDQVNEISYAEMQEKLDAFFTNFQKQCGLTTEQIKLLREAMTDTLYQDSTLDETINALEDSINKEKILADKQKEIDEEYKLRWYNWALSGTAMSLKLTPGMKWVGRGVEALWGAGGRTAQKKAAEAEAKYEVDTMDTSETEQLIASLERLTATSGAALDAIGAYSDLLDSEGKVLLTAQEFLEGLNIDAINEAFKQGGNGAGYEEIIRQLARQIENTDDKELKKALQDKLNEAVSELEITAEFSWKNLGSELETITTDLRSMNEIMAEFNENGGISLDTFLELCELLDKVDMESLFEAGLVEEYIGLLDKLNLGFDESTGYITAEADSMETLQDIQQVLAKTQLLATIQKLKNTKAGLQAELDMVAVEKNATKAAIDFLKKKGEGTVKLSEIEEAASSTYQEGMNNAMKKAAEAYKAMTADSRVWATATIQNAAAVNEAINKAYTNDFSVDSLEKTLSNITSEMKWEGINASGIYGISDGENVEVGAAIAQLEEYSTKLDNTSSDIESRIKKIDAMIIGLNKLVNSDLSNLGADAEDIEKYIGQLEEIYNLLRKIEGAENRLSHLEDYQDLSRGDDYARYLQERIGLTNDLTSSYKKLLAEQKYIENTEQAAIKGSPVGDVFSFDEFGNIIIDYQKYINLSDEHKKLADDLYEEYQDIHETTNEYYEDLINNINKALEAQQQLVDTYVDLENDLADAVKDIYQDMLDNKLDAIDKEIEALDKLREARDRANQSKQDSKDLSNLQTSLKRSMMDTSGASNTKVLDYQDQIQAKLDQMGEDEYTRRLDSITEALEAEKEQLQRNFDEFFEDWTTFHDMIESRILPNEEAVLEVLKTTDAYLQAGDAERAQMVDEWTTNYKTAMTAMQNGGTIMDVVNSIKELKDSIPDIDLLLQDKDYWEEVGTGFSKALIEWFEDQKNNGKGDDNKNNNTNGNMPDNNEKPKDSKDSEIKNYDDIKAERGDKGGAIKKWWDELVQSIGDFFKITIPNFFKNLPELIGKGLAAVANFIFDDVFNFLTKGLWEFLFVTVPKAIGDAIKWCVDTFNAFIDWVCSLPEKFMDALKAAAEWVQNAFTAVINGIIDFCKRVYESFAANVSEEALENFQKIVDFFTGIGQTIKDFFVSAGQWVAAQVQAMHDKAVAIAQKIVEQYNKFKEAMKAAFKAVADFFKEKIDNIGQWFANLGEKIVNAIKTAFNWITEKFGWVKDYFKETVNTINNFFIGLGESITSKITGAWTSIKDGAKNAWQGIKDVFGNIPQWFKDKFTAAWTAVKNVFSSGGKIFDGIKDGIANTFKTIVNGIITGINKVIKTPFDTINGLLNKIRNAEILGISPFKDLWKENPLSVPQIPQFLHGGMVDFTGPAWLDGTKSAPEAVLNAAQTKAFMKLADNLDRFEIDGMGGNIHIESIEFRVDSMSSVADGEKAFDAFVNRFKEIGRQTGLTMNTARLK